MTDEGTPDYRLQKARERERVVSAIVRAQSEWREILEVLESSESAEAAQDALARTFGLAHDQVWAVLDTQFRRVSRADRDRIADELASLRAEIAELEREL